jgi:hypothetical protein
MEAYLEREQAKADAVTRDGTEVENNALEAKALLGEGGPATDREALQVDFWDNIHPSMANLDDALPPDRVAAIAHWTMSRKQDRTEPGCLLPLAWCHHSARPGPNHRRSRRSRWMNAQETR